MHGSVSSLYRYPIKGLSPERMPAVELEAGLAFPGDRLYALAKPHGRYDADDFSPLPKREYFVLMNTERLAGLVTKLDVATTSILTVTVGGHTVLEADLGTEQGRRDFVELYARVVDLPEGETPLLARHEGYNFTDNAPSGPRLMNSVSLINLASVDDFATRVGHAVDPLRFRGNIHLDGVPAWAERDWVGRIVRLGGVTLRVLEESGRCAATEVDPVTAHRDIPVPRLLQQHYGHDIVGVYAEVLEGGTVRDGDAVEILETDAPLGVIRA
jgi:uncharacterized protein YcbX